MAKEIKELNNYRLLKKKAKDLGAQLFGIADIAEEKQSFDLAPPALENLNRAISIGVGLSPKVLETIEEAPTKIYFHHYRTLNVFLDQLAFRLTQLIQAKGFQALPIPASQILDWQRQSAHLSHKRIGFLAGLGWIGRNNLLVNADLGAQFRLVTILTNMPLKIDKPREEDCGDCRLCIEACPVGAIKERKENFDHQACFSKLKEFQKSGLVGQYICGVCVKACKPR